MLLINVAVTAQKGGWRFEAASGPMINRENKTGYGVNGHTKSDWAYVGYKSTVFPYPDFSFSHIGAGKYWYLFHQKLQLEVGGNYTIYRYRYFNYLYLHHGSWTEIVLDGTLPHAEQDITLAGSIQYRIFEKPKYKVIVSLRGDKSIPYKSSWSNFFTYNLGVGFGFRLRSNHTLWVKPEIGWYRDGMDIDIFSQDLTPKLSVMYDIDRIKKKH